MKSYNYYKEILERNGYKYQFTDCIDGFPSYICFANDKRFVISLGVQPNDEYEDELNSLCEGDEYVVDFDKMEVYAAFIECSICNVAGFMDNDRSGIRLKDESKGRYGLLDALDEDGSYQDYYPHKMDLFEKCLWIQNNVGKHEEYILECHLRNLKRINGEFDKILRDFDFYPVYSSLLDCKKNCGDKKENSNPYIEYSFYIDRFSLYFDTDCITGELLVGGRPLGDADFKEYLIKNAFTDKELNEIKLEFRYLFDKDYNKDTYGDVCNVWDIIGDIERGRKNRIYDLKKFDFKNIPEKDFGHIFKKVKEILEENK